MKQILEERWNYILIDDNGKLLLSVICGTVGLYDTNVYLNESELADYYREGEKYIKELAARIRYSPKSYNDRHVKIDFNQINQ